MQDEPCNGGQVGVFVLLPLRHLNGRLAGYVTNEKIDENILAVARLIDRFVQQRAQPISVQHVIVAMINGRSCQDHRILVGPLGRVSPLTLIEKNITQTNSSVKERQAYTLYTRRRDIGLESILKSKSLAEKKKEINGKREK